MALRPSHYDRKVGIWRTVPSGEEGALGYGGKVADDLKPVFSDIACSIQAQRSGSTNPTGLPADTMASKWRVFIPAGVVRAGQIKTKDLLIDDLGRRFDVTHDYCHRHGWTLSVDRLEA